MASRPQIYDLFLPLADRIELTEIHAAPNGDTNISAFDPKIWKETKRENHAAEDNIPAYSFVTLQRIEAD